MSPDPDLADKLAQGFSVFATDRAAALEVFDSDLAWTIAGAGRWAGTTLGLDEVLQMFAALVADTDGTYRGEPVAFLAGTANAAAVVRVRAARAGATLDVGQTVVFTWSGERFTHALQLPHDQHAFDTFFA